MQSGVLQCAQLYKCCFKPLNKPNAVASSYPLSQMRSSTGSTPTPGEQKLGLGDMLFAWIADANAALR